MKLGTMTISGQWPQELDGLFLGYSDRQTKVFKWRTDGFERRGKLYKTLDPAILIEGFGVVNATYKFNLSKEIR